MKYFFKKNIVAIILSILVFFFVSLFSLTSSFFYDNEVFVFDAFKIDGAVNEDGSMRIKERITVTFDFGYNGEFWRDIVTDKNDNGESKNQSSFNPNNFSMKIYDETGSTLLYDSTTNYKSDDVKLVGYSWNRDRDSEGNLIKFEGYNTNGVCAYSYVPTLKHSTRIYEFEYVLDGFVTCYNDIAEINNNFFDPIDTTEISNVEVNITLPNLTSSQGIELFTHKAITYDEKIENNVVSYKINKIYPGDAIESRILFPRSSITNTNSNNVINEDGYEYLKGLEDKIKKEDAFFMKYGNYLVFGIGFILVIVFIVAIYKVYIEYDKEYVPEFNGDYYRELPASYQPVIMSYLVNFKEINRNDLTATLLDLIRKGFIDVDYTNQSLTDKNANYTLNYNRNKDQTELANYEKFTLEWFFDIIGQRHDYITLDDIEAYAKKMNNAEKYKECNVKWNNLAKSECQKYNFFEEKAKYLTSSKYGIAVIITLVIGIIGIFISFSNGSFIISLPYVSAFIVSISIVGISYMATIIRRTKEANEEYFKWMAFKKFLTDFGNMQDYPIPALTIWEQYLVYATSFGIADLVSKQLKLKYTEQELIDSRTYSMTYFDYYMYRRMTRIYVHADASYQKLVSQRSSSSSGRSRFGGGSSFGGGGGGARGR